MRVIFIIIIMVMTEYEYLKIVTMIMMCHSRQTTLS